MRLPGWERRLSDLLTEAAARPYVLGDHDCFRLACADQNAMIGIDRWPEFCGYRTEREALTLIAQHGSNFEAAFDWFFGAPHVDWTLGRRGDIACLEDSSGRKHLGVINGSTIAGLREDGLIYAPLSAARCVWRIG